MNSDSEQFRRTVIAKALCLPGLLLLIADLLLTGRAPALAAGWATENLSSSAAAFFF